MIHIEKSGDVFRLLYDCKGRFVLHTILEGEAGFKLGRVVSSGTSAKNIPYVVTHDGRTFRYPDPLIAVNDTVKIDLTSGKIQDFVKFEVGNTAMITRGRNTGRIGVIEDREEHPGSFDIVHVKDAKGVTFATRLSNVFIIGKGNEAKDLLISLPKDKGVKYDIFHERAERDRKAKEASK